MMKRIKNPFVNAIFGAVLSLAIMMSCSKDKATEPDNNAGGSPPPAALVDTWTFQSVKVNGVAVDLDSALELHSGAVAAKITVYVNGAFVYEEVNGSGGQVYFESGFVIVEGNEIEIVVEQNSGGAVNESTTVTYVLNGSTLTVTSVEGGFTIVFVLTS